MRTTLRFLLALTTALPLFGLCMNANGQTPTPAPRSPDALGKATTRAAPLVRQAAKAITVNKKAAKKKATKTKALSLRPTPPARRVPAGKRVQAPPTSAPGKGARPFWMHRLNQANWPVQFIPTLEFGFLAPLSHTIRFGDNGTNFDYIKDGGQDNLFVFLRLSLDLLIAKRHIVTLLYQPLDIRTEIVLRNEFKTDQATYNAGQPVNTRYGFDFFRISYMYDVLPSPDMELGFGLSLQIRNAAITFSSVDGSKRSFRNDIGPVPVLKTRGRFMLPKRFWVGFEIDGFYAPVSFLNGSDSEIVGAILDASIRFGKEITPLVDAFLNIRYLGGGASGRDNNTGEANSDGFINNWLHFLTISVGFSLR